MTKTTKKPTKRKPASVLAWGLQDLDGSVAPFAFPNKTYARDECYASEKIVRVRITVVPKGVKR